MLHEQVCAPSKCGQRCDSRASSWHHTQPCTGSLGESGFKAGCRLAAASPCTGSRVNWPLQMSAGLQLRHTMPAHMPDAAEGGQGLLCAAGVHLGSVPDDEMSSAHRVERHVQLGTRHHPVVSAFETLLAELPGPDHAVGVPAAMRTVRRCCVVRTTAEGGQTRCWCAPRAGKPAGGLLRLTPWHDRAGEPCAPA